ncbi:PAS domain S-box protein [Bradyrhizobium sp. STM 3843]|uniref:sensor histidine kinase n=1 Tax=Bradyrhizobium sp. STM 3843 TaxID=551947 RepID=UPI00158601CC|nr:PAS domain S-box protein [Bradyrhizobium sp. STM 3843]
MARIGITATICADHATLVDRLSADCLAVVATEEGLFGRDLAPLTAWVRNQPAWSDLPFVILTSHLPQRRVAVWRTELVASLHNVTLLERPVQVITLTSSIRAAVRARNRQYELQALLGELETGNERLRLIAENASDYAIMFSDAEDNIVSWLPGAAAVFGWDQQEMLGKPASTIFTPEDRAKGVPEQELSRARADGEAPNTRWHVRKDGGLVFLDGKTVALRNVDGTIRGFLKIGQDVTERQRNEERQAVLLAELQHRVRNVLAMVGSLVNRGDSGSTTREFRERLGGRIAALARTQALLTRGAGVGVDLESLIHDELLSQAADAARVTIGGPRLTLAPKAAEVLTLAIHELATNAAKYGALRVPTGRIASRWKVEPVNGQSWLELDWQESGVEIAPQQNRRKGFGTELITRRVPYELKGRGALDLDAGGLRCHIAFPLKAGESILQTDRPPPPRQRR